MGGGAEGSGNARRWVIRGIDDSLRRGQTGWIDLYQVHRPDPSTDIEETLSVLSDLMSAGEIRAFGCSAFPPEQIVEAHAAATPRGLPSFRTQHAPHSPLAPGIYISGLPLFQRPALRVVARYPL